MNLQVAISDVAECQKELAIEIGADDVREEYVKAYDAYARYAKVPGFRQGNVPKSVIKQRFAKEIKGEVIQQIVPHALGHVVEDHKLRVIGNPEVNPDEIQLREGEPLKFKARVTILPEFELLPYKGLKVVRKTAKVTDEAVDEALKEIREHSAQLVPVEDRASQAGDFVSVNLTGKYIDPVEEEDLSTDDLSIEIGAEGVQPEFSEALTGTKEGDVRTFTVKYPEDFTSKGLAGKTLEFTATVTAVKFKELPALDDDFAREVAEEHKEDYTTLAGMRDSLKKNIEAHAKADAEARLRDSLLEEIVKGYEFPLPAPLVDSQVRSRLNDFVQRLVRSGVPPQAVKSLNWEERRAEEARRAENDVRIALILGEIADKEQILITQEDVDVEVERIATEMGRPLDVVEEHLTKNGHMTSIQNRLRSDKVISFLVGAAVISDEEFVEEFKEDLAQELLGESDSKAEEKASEVSAKAASETDSEASAAEKAPKKKAEKKPRKTSEKTAKSDKTDKADDNLSAGAAGSDD